MPGARVMNREGLGALIQVLRGRGYAVVGPTVQRGAVVLAEIQDADELPWAVGAEQEAGQYRLVTRPDGAAFANAAAVQGIKSTLFPAEELIWRGRRSGQTFEVTETTQPDLQPTAFVGVRSCDLAALAQHDQILTGRGHPDVRYARRREGAFLVAVTCVEPGGTCFCASMGTGPRAASGCDLAMTELTGPRGPHRFVVEIGSELGSEVLAEVPTAAATSEDVDAVEDAVADATGRMGREMATEGLRDTVYAAAESPVWDEVGSRCLTCMNCTMVCPTCFCTTVEDVSVLGSADAERRRVWDSCFSEDFAHIHGGSLRSEPRWRYRQWLTHKLAAWTDQFDAIGCVGCGRCITWCPVGIDITAEVATLQATSSAGSSS
jgi:sulfhydrogenase subunit beta (sulfur reductase)